MIAIGPVSKEPSWKWVGLDTIKELSKYFTIEVFNSYKHLPNSRIILIIKKLPPIEFVRKARKNGKEIVYCPIDYFNNKQDINMFGMILSQCTIILSHAESLIPIFNQFSHSYLVEHNGKYTLPKMAQYKDKGYVLWIGGYQFVPYLLKYMETHSCNFKIKLLTDYKKKNAIGRANTVSRSIGIQLNTENLDMYEWNENLQKEMMQECKAAIDIKGDDFAQKNKPPTKGQKYITSGIPFAINKNNNCYNYFKNKGFNICSPGEEKRWLSKKYWEKTQKFGKHLASTISIEEVGKTYCGHILKLLNKKDKQTNGIGFTINRAKAENFEHNPQD